MAIQDRIPKVTAKRKRALLRYDKDIDITVLFRVDLLQGDVPTPVTPMYANRLDFESIKGKAVPARGFNPREVECCHKGGVNRTVYIPYMCGTYEHKQHLTELVELKNTNFNGLETLVYTGEST